jgi:hypothetical protein
MNIASGYATEYGYGTNGQVYVAPDYNGAGCVPYRPADSIQLDTVGTYGNQEDNAPKPNAYVLTQNQCPGTSYEDQWYFTSASNSILQTNVTVTVWLEKAPDPIPAITSISNFCFATGGTTTINGSNFTGVNKVYGYGGYVLSNASVNVISDTQVEVTVPANTYGTIGIGTATSGIGWAYANNGSCASGVPNYNPVYNPPSPPPVPTPTPPNTNVCMSGWTFGIKTNTTYLWDGPKIVDYNGAVFMAPNAGTWTLNAIETCLDFNIADVYAQNGAYLNPGAGEIIQIIDWGYPYDGSYYVYSNSLLGAVQRRLQLSCTNTSPTPTPSPIQTGTCIAPANTNTGPFAFPTSPSVNQIYSFNGRAWYWNGYAWNRYCVGTTTAPTPIAEPLTGTLSYSGNTYNLTFGDTLSSGNAGGWNSPYVSHGFHAPANWQEPLADRMLMVYKTTDGVVFWGLSIAGLFSTSVPLDSSQITPNGTNTYTYTHNYIVYTSTVTWGAVL